MPDIGFNDYPTENYTKCFHLRSRFSLTQSRGSGENWSWKLKGKIGLTENTLDIISRNKKLPFNINDSLQIPESSGTQTKGGQLWWWFWFSTPVRNKCFHIYFSTTEKWGLRKKCWERWLTIKPLNLVLINPF